MKSGQDMVMTQAMPEQKQEPDPSFVHWVWDDDPDESLCGKDVTGHTWYSDGTPVDCTNCIEVDKFVTWLEEKLNG